MPRDGAFILSDVLGPTLSIVCEPCGRHETYNVARLGATLELGQETPGPLCGDKGCRAASARIRWANFPWTSSASNARTAVELAPIALTA